MRPITERRRVPVSRRAWPVLVVAVLVACTTALLARPAGANAVGTVTVTVDRDYVGDGNYHAPTAGQAGDVAQPGMTVTVTDVRGKTVQKTTGATGIVTITAGDGLTAPYRVDVSIPAPYSNYLGLAPVKSGGTFDPATSFVDPSNGKAVALRVAVWDPADYAPSGTQLAVPVESNNGPAGWSTDDTSLVTTPNTPQGAVKPVAHFPATGTTFGAAWDKTSKLIYTSAFAKAYADYGPDGAGAVYSVNPSTGQVATFAVVAGAGSTLHNATDIKLDNDSGPVRPVSGFYPVPGTQSLGGLAMSEDGSTLYVVNMNTKELVGINTATKAQTATAIPDPNCVNGQWRPMAVSAHDGAIFVGGVCDASGDGATRADLKAVVLRFQNGAFAGTPYYAHGLDFARAPVTPVANNDIGTHWNPWTQDYSEAAYTKQINSFFVVRPEPELASISFDSDESMVLGFRDRTGDQLGIQGPIRIVTSVTPTGVTTGVLIVSVMTGGDVNRVCSSPTGFVWDGDPGCRNANNAATYYPQDTSIDGQDEAAQGSTVLVPQLGQLTSTFLDPAATPSTDGLGFFTSNGTSGPTGGDPARTTVITRTTYSVSPTGAITGTSGSGVGKANGLGAIALMAAQAPLEIGNRVWLDSNRNGVQDAGESPLSHAKVTLLSGGKPVLDQNGQPVVAFTDSHGAYYFGGPASTYQLVPGQTYTVQFDVSTVTNLPTGVATSTLRYTATKAGGDDRHDSNAVQVSGAPQLGTAAVPTLGAVSTDHTIDAGVYSTSIPVPPPGGSPPAGPPPGKTTPPGSGQPPGTTTVTTVLINTGRPAGPHGGNPWFVAGGVAALAGSGLALVAGWHRRKRVRSLSGT